MSSRIVVTSNQELKKKILDKMKENGGYCPCKLLKNQDTKCMCEEFRKQFIEGIEGECHCGLYEVVNNE